MNDLLSYKKYLLLVLFVIVLLPLSLRINTITSKKTIIPSPYPTTTTYKDAENRLIEKISNRTPLSSTDNQVKQKILLTLPPAESSGIIYKTPNYTIEYIHAPDLFKVELMTQDYTAAKKDAVKWFREQGMSPEGICNLPLSFYVNSEILHQIDQDAFNPLPEGC